MEIVAIHIAPLIEIRIITPTSLILPEIMSSPIQTRRQRIEVSQYRRVMLRTD